MEITKTWNFNVDEKSIICLLNRENKLINIIMQNDDVIEITKKDVGTQDMIIETYGEKPIMLVFIKENDSEETKITKFYSWDSDNWISKNDNSNTINNPTSETKAFEKQYKYNDIWANSNDKHKIDIKGANDTPGFDINGEKVARSNEYFKNKISNLSYPSTNEFNEYVNKMAEGIDFSADPGIESLVKQVPSYGVIGNNPNTGLITKETLYNYDFDIDKFSFEILISNNDEFGSSTSRYNNVTSTNRGTTNLPISYFSNLIKITKDDFLQDSGQTIQNSIKQIAKGNYRFVTYYSYGIPVTVGSSNEYKQIIAASSLEIQVGSEWIPVFLKSQIVSRKDGSLMSEDQFGEFTNCFAAAPKLSFEYTRTAQTGLKSFDFISKYIPDSYSFGSLSYNLLTLRSNDDISKMDIAEWKSREDELIKVDEPSEVDTLASINLINGYYSQTGIESTFKASLNLIDESQRANYRFGWIWTSLEEWAKIESQSGSTVKEYIDSVIKPSFSTPNGSSEKSFFVVTPKTNDQYILVAFATKLSDTELDQATTLTGILSTQINVVPVQTYGVKSSPYETVQSFYKTTNSIVYKNQMFLYGGSNTFFVSDVNNFGYFPMLNNLQIPSDSPIVSMVTFYDSIIIATSRQQFILSGNTPSTFQINELNNDIGVVSPKTVKNNSNYIFQLTEDGVYKVKTLFNFRDRYNVEKVDNAIKGQIIPAEDSSAVVFQNRYYINIPSKNEIWVYYNDWQSWIKYSSPIFNLIDMIVINNKLYLISKNSFDIFKFDTTAPDVHGNGSYKDKNQYGDEYNVESIYKSKEIAFGLPNHDKKFKKLQTRFADTPGQNEVFYTVKVDSTTVVDPEKVEVTYDALNNAVIKKVIKKPAITTTSNTNFDLPDSKYANTKNPTDGNKYNEDVDQLHEIIVAGRGRQIQFIANHIQDKALNIKNFGVLLKVKKPKAQRTKSTRP